MNLFDQFILQQTQFSSLHADLNRVPAKKGNREAKIEFNLTPRLLPTPSDADLPIYQVTARLECRGMDEAEDEPAFVVRIVMEAVYRQVSGERMELEEFSGRHIEFTRQLFPLLHQQLQQMLNRLGLEQLRIPADMPTPSADTVETTDQQIH